MRLVGTQAVAREKAAMERRAMKFFMLVIEEFFFATKARRHKVKTRSVLSEFEPLWLNLRQFQIYVIREK